MKISELEDKLRYHHLYSGSDFPFDFTELTDTVERHWGEGATSDVVRVIVLAYSLGYYCGGKGKQRRSPMNVSELIEHLKTMPQDAPVASLSSSVKNYQYDIDDFELTCGIVDVHQKTP